MMFTTKNVDNAVSPVVGVILMVAVTVILAAVIGTFVLGLGNQTQANPQGGVAFSQDANGANFDVTVQAVSMERVDYMQVKNTSDTWWNATGGEQATKPVAGNAALQNVGDTVTLLNQPSGTDVTVIGNLDGKESVLQTYTVR